MAKGSPKPTTKGETPFQRFERLAKRIVQADKEKRPKATRKASR